MPEMPGLGGVGGCVCGFWKADRRHCASAMGPLPPRPAARVCRRLFGERRCLAGLPRSPPPASVRFPWPARFHGQNFCAAGCFWKCPCGVMPLRVCAHVDARACATHARVTLRFPVAWPCLPPRGAQPRGRGGGRARTVGFASKANCKARGGGEAKRAAADSSSSSIIASL